MSYLIAVGACYLDTILTVEHYPLEDEKQRAISVVRRRGGNSPNTLEVLQQLLDVSGIAMSLVQCAVLPSRSSTSIQEIKSSFGAGVDLTHCIYRDECNEPASSYIIKSNSTDSRTIVNYNGLPEMTSDEFIKVIDELELDAKASWCHFEASLRLFGAPFYNFLMTAQGRIPEVTLKCIRYLRQHFPSMKVSVEVEKPSRIGLKELAAKSDVVFYSKSWAQGNGYRTPEECLRAQAPLTPQSSLLCCTWGDEGVSALELPSLTYRHCHAWLSEGSRAVDTIGAGDTFIAGMLYGLTCHGADWDLLHKLEFASHLAGHKVAQEGFLGLGTTMQQAT